MFHDRIFHVDGTNNWQSMPGVSLLQVVDEAEFKAENWDPFLRLQSIHLSVSDG